MAKFPLQTTNRRRVLKYSALAGGAALAGCVSRIRDSAGADDDHGFPEPHYGDPDQEYQLTATESEVMVDSGESHDGWTYNGEYPGPELRAVEGERLGVTVENDLPEETTIHWHGLVLDGDNAMDGVPGFTQAAIEPGEEYGYEFGASPVQ